MSDFRPDLDARTCSVCGEPVAEHLRGFMGSLRGCALHLEAWAHLPERNDAALEAIRTGRFMGHGPFEAWATKRRNTMQAMEEI